MFQKLDRLNQCILPENLVFVLNCPWNVICDLVVIKACQKFFMIQTGGWFDSTRCFGDSSCYSLLVSVWDTSKTRKMKPLLHKLLLLRRTNHLFSTFTGDDPDRLCLYLFDLASKYHSYKDWSNKTSLQRTNLRANLDKDKGSVLSRASCSSTHFSTDHSLSREYRKIRYKGDYYSIHSRTQSYSRKSH